LAYLDVGAAHSALLYPPSHWRCGPYEAGSEAVQRGANTSPKQGYERTTASRELTSKLR